MKTYFPTKSIVDKINIEESRDTFRAKYYTIVNTVIWNAITRTEEYFETGKRLNQKLHINKLISYDRSGELIKDLLEWKVLEITDDNYQQGIKAKAYQIHSSHPLDKLIAVPITAIKTRLTDKLAAKTKKSTDILCKRIKAIMQNYVRIDSIGLRYLRMKYPLLTPAIVQYESGETIKDELYNHVHIQLGDLQLFRIFIGDIEVMRPEASSRKDTKSRIYYNFTQLPSRFRRVLLLNGKHLHYVDISNCQPCLSVSLIYNHLLQKSGKSKSQFLPPADFVDYQTMCETGKLYKELGKKFNKFRKEDEEKYTDEGYDEFKIQCFSEIFYSKRPSGTLGTVFTNLFPTVATAMQELKGKKESVKSNIEIQKKKKPSKLHAQFAVMLQQSESKLMLDTVLKPLLMKGHLLLPLHDALYVSDPALVPIVQDLIASEFLRLYNVRIKTKTEDVLLVKKRISLKKQKQKENEEWFQQFSIINP